jgi:hypothetical protein
MLGATRSLLVAWAFLAINPALSAEPSGCDKFAWPLVKEQSLLAKPQPAETIATSFDRNVEQAFSLRLVLAAEARLPNPPERPPKKATAFAGFAQFGATSTGGSYKVSLSEGAWIDVVQEGRYLKPTAFTGATDCPNVRKSVKFDIGPAPFTLQISDAPSDKIAIVVTRAD